MCQVVRSIKDFRSLSIQGSIGFVPTMGGLHCGHASLLHRSKQENAVTVMSLFVNPSQFNDSEDYNSYPQDIDADLVLAKDCGVDLVLIPDAKEMYPEGVRFQLTEERESLRMEGTYRPGHFNGVLTVVLKLLNIVQAKRVYFGEKDYQQYLLVRDMVKDLFLPVEVIPCSTVRESNGLAFSTRNQKLSVEGREKAPMLFKTLSEFGSCAEIKKTLLSEGFDVEYVEEHEGRRFAAVNLEDVRLIDNVCV